ncbi:MAG: SDR family NAD(P)-dependent oxidoreductase [Acidimicrobiia bacterium]
MGTAVVTGASRGIGRATAIELARRGFDVVATMRDPATGEGLEAAGEDRLRVQRLDVNDAASIALPSDLRVLVNNAGVEDDNLPLETMPSEIWRKLFETNVFGLVEVTKRAVPIMRAGGGGVICNVTSSSILAPVPFLAAYRASKAAVGAIGESLQAEVGQFGIRVVEIMPGPIETDMLAASDRPAAAIDDAPYRALAESMWASRQSIRDAYTPAAEAARRIVDAILDDDGPLRYGCDDMSEGMLEGWRSVASDDAWLRPLFEAFSPPGSGARTLRNHRRTPTGQQ